MSYCRICGREIEYKRTKNEKWMPCNALTGEPHFCEEKDKDKSGLQYCKNCGKPIFEFKKGRKITVIDYTTLEFHCCKYGDITRFEKYKSRISKKELKK